MSDMEQLNLCIRITELVLRKHEQRYHNAAQYGSEQQRIQCHHRCRETKYQLWKLRQERRRMGGEDHG